MEPLTITSRWSGTFEWVGAPHAGSYLAGWPGDVQFETRHQGPAKLSFESGCVTWGTYTDMVVWVDRDALNVSPYQVEPGPPYLSEDSTTTLPAGEHVLHAWTNGVLSYGCPWTITLTRPQ